MELLDTCVHERHHFIRVFYGGYRKRNVKNRNNSDKIHIRLLYYLYLLHIKNKTYNIIKKLE